MGFADALALHDNEAQAIDHAVVLIVVLRQIVEGGFFFVLRGPWIWAIFSL